MSFADDVRAYAYERVIAPARARGARSATVHARDVHDGLGYKSRFPLVCSALGSKKFQDEYGVKLSNIDGPIQSSTTTFTYVW